MKNLVGTTIGQHEIVEQLGRGGMANVYKAFHPGLAVHRAIKVIRPELADTQGFQDRFQREARAVAALRHPNIVQIHDFGQQDDLFYMIMEFVEGEDLKSRMIREGAIRPFSETVRLISQIAEALGYAHERGVVHRDVKPDNVLLNADGEAILADFGIAKIIEADDAKLTATGTGLGTPAYMAPEQAKGATDVGERADLYAVGVVLYEMLTARLPFHADTPLAVLQRVIYDPVPPPREFTADIPDALQGVVLKAMEKDPAKRYQNASAFVEAAKASLVGMSTGVAPEVSGPGAPVVPPPPPANTPITAGGTVILGEDDSGGTGDDSSDGAESAAVTLPAPSATTQDVAAANQGLGSQGVAGQAEGVNAEVEEGSKTGGNRTVLLVALAMVVLFVLLGAGAIAVGVSWWKGRTPEFNAESDAMAAFANKTAGSQPMAGASEAPETGSSEASESRTLGTEAGSSSTAGSTGVETDNASEAAPTANRQRVSASKATSTGVGSRTVASGSQTGAGSVQESSAKASNSEEWRNRRAQAQASAPVPTATTEPSARFLGRMRFGSASYGEVEPEEPVEFALEIKRKTTFYFDIVTQSRRATYTLTDPDGVEVFREEGSDVGPLVVEKKGLYSLRVETAGDMPIDFEVKFNRIGNS